MNSIAEKNAKESAGISDSEIYKSVVTAIQINLKNQEHQDLKLVDIGCGTGNLLNRISQASPKLILSGIDLVNYTDIKNINFIKQDFNEDFDVEDSLFDIVVCTEVIEHLENPRHLLRQISKISKKGGLIVLTTPNLYSILSIISFALKGYHSSFGPKNYPAHITAVSAFDIKNMISEIQGLELTDLTYISNGRIPGTSKNWREISKAFKGKLFSDNYMVTLKRV